MRLFAEAIGTESWIAIIGSIGGLIGVVIAGIGGWIYKLKLENNKTMLAIKELELKDKKVDKTRTVRELEESIDQLARDRDSDRQTIHELRGQAQQYMLTATKHEVRLQACEEDRQELRQRLSQLTHFLEDSGINFTDPGAPEKG